MVTDEFGLNNRIEISGRFAKLNNQFTDAFGQTYAEIIIESVRMSGVIDLCPTIIPIDEIKSWEIGEFVQIEGEVRSKNYIDEEGRSHLKIYIKTFKSYNLSAEYKAQEVNEVNITGYLVRQPMYRLTPFGKEISDLLVAVHRRSGLSDYLPCIVWGRNARFADHMNVGDCISLGLGRFQSREYIKLFPDGEEIRKIAFELSFGSLMLIK